MFLLLSGWYFIAMYLLKHGLRQGCKSASTASLRRPGIWIICAFPQADSQLKTKERRDKEKTTQTTEMFVIST